MTTVMPIDEPRPRGTVLGERTDRQRVHEAEHFFRCKETAAYPPSAASWVRANLYGPPLSRHHRADARRRRADDPATLLHLIACRMGQGLLVLKHSAEIAAVKMATACFKFEK